LKQFVPNYQKKIDWLNRNSEKFNILNNLGHRIKQEIYQIINQIV